MTQNTPHARIGADLWALWEKAAPLNQARYRFGDQAQAKEYFSLINEKPGRFGVFGAIVAAMASAAKTSVPIESELRTTPEEWHRVSELASAIDHACIGRLQRRQLVALGFSIPRHPDDPPRIVPPELFRLDRVNFSRDSAAGDGLKFEAIRVILAETIDQSLPAPNRPGRPSKRELITQVYVACRDAGSIDFTKPQKAAIEIVQARIRALYPAEYGLGKGFGPEVVRDCIADDFATRGKNQKL